MILFYTF